MSSKGEVHMKFCESLDRFVEIRRFTDEEVQKIFQNIKITDKKSYKRLIISTAVVNYLDEIAPLIFGNNNYSLFGEITEQELYNLCIQVNPELDIKKVTITIKKDNEDQNIPLLDNLPEGGIDVSERFINMEKYLKKRIIGQDEAVGLVSQAIRKAHVGLRNPDKPIGSFMFAGQTGVGKTELAKVLAEFLFGDEKELVRVDCSEYSQSHEYAKLIGAPPGYIGHKEGGFLTEAIKNKPKAVVLFDEIEKAHPKVHNILLQIMDDGILTDSQGELISFKDCVSILTTNVGVEEFRELDKVIGFGSDAMKKDHQVRVKETVRALEKIFPPEFLNRVDEIVTFKALDKSNMIDILEIQLREVLIRLNKLGIEIDMGTEVREFIVELGSNVKYGARPLKRAVKNLVENPLAEGILEGRFKKSDKMRAFVDAESREQKIIKYEVVAGGTPSLEKDGVEPEKEKEKKKSSRKKEKA
ncbi:MAG: AAA family ATPase [Candidatus Wallbacteria bacterium]|nr:AAA family ATPase [Candidatus Wallbacteria bacterium]